ncbi:zinc dependent phospholipase C family protein [bacterium]|jgi:hypothetical protein|nr:hypothetical protein [Gemmatimonadota bacterium]MCH2665670.1 zinc dependent phospholipase C family protein [bacterium]
MPRSRCHFALLSKLHDALKVSLPDVAAVAGRELSAFCAGSVAPDALRYFSGLGKFGTHFYSEDRKETWGKAVSGMFEAHPDLSDPGSLSERNLAVVIGYISHLTVDEAFRDVVTYQVHGVEDWRPIIRGLWSHADEMDVGYRDLVDTVADYDGSWNVGFVDGQKVKAYLDLVAPWSDTADPWASEQGFMRLVNDKTPEVEAKVKWERNRQKAADFLDNARKEDFVKAALRLGVDEVQAYVNGGYSKMSCT